MAGRMWHILGGLWRKLTVENQASTMFTAKKQQKIIKTEQTSQTIFQYNVQNFSLANWSCKKKQSLDLTGDINYLLSVKAAVFKLRGETLEGVSVL